MSTLRILLLSSLAITFLSGPTPAAAQLAHPLIWMDMDRAQPKPQPDIRMDEDQSLEGSLESSLRKLGSEYPRTRQDMLRRLLVMRRVYHLRHQVPMIDQIIKILIKLERSLNDTLERKIRF